MISIDFNDKFILSEEKLHKLNEYGCVIEPFFCTTVGPRKHDNLLHWNTVVTAEQLLAKIPFEIRDADNKYELIIGGDVVDNEWLYILTYVNKDDYREIVVSKSDSSLVEACADILIYLYDNGYISCDDVAPQGLFSNGEDVLDPVLMDRLVQELTPVVEAEVGKLFPDYTSDLDDVSKNMTLSSEKMYFSEQTSTGNDGYVYQNSTSDKTIKFE